VSLPAILALATALAGTAEAVLVEPLSSRGGALAQRPDAIRNVRDFGARGDGVHDDAPAIVAAEAALPATGGTVHFPAGVYAVGAAPILFRRSHVRFEGVGPASILRKVRPGGPILATSAAHPGIRGISVSRLRFEFALGPPRRDVEVAILLSDGARDVAIDGCEFWDFRDYAVLLRGVTNALVDGCSFASPGEARGIAIQAEAGPERIVVRRSRFRYLRGGFVVAAKARAGETARDISVEKNDFDFGWWLIKAISAREGPPVRYTATTLVDHEASFAELDWGRGDASLHDVRVMPIKSQGRGDYGPTTLLDPAADFVAADVLAGEIVRAGDAFAVVGAVEGRTRLELEPWLSQETYLPVEPPPAGAEYTLYGVVLGLIARASDRALEVRPLERWFDLAGRKVVPAPGTRYEVLRPRQSYPCHAEDGTARISVRDNTFRRGWADQVSVYGDEATVTGNLVERGEDVGITVHGRRNYVAGNVVRFQGSSGLWLHYTEESLIENNFVADSQWVNADVTVVGDVTVRNGKRNWIRRNRCQRTSSPGKNGIVVIAIDGATAEGDTVEENDCRGHVVADYAVRGVKGGVVRGVRLRDNLGDVKVEGATDFVAGRTRGPETGEGRLGWHSQARCGSC
jgi:hypothetical protein